MPKFKDFTSEEEEKQIKLLQEIYKATLKTIDSEGGSNPQLVMKNSEEEIKTDEDDKSEA